MNKAIFLDRDGTINVDRHYLYKPEDFELLRGVPEALAEMKRMGYLLIVITNQSGIARGYYTEEDMRRLHEHMRTLLGKYQVQLDGIYYCPHHPKGSVPRYSVPCGCRKPKTGLFEAAIREFEIDTRRSYAIGDRDRDLIPGRALGMKCIKIGTERVKSDRWPLFAGLAEAVQWIALEEKNNE